MVEWIVGLAVVVAAGWAVARLRFWGADLSAFDRPVAERFRIGEAPSAAALDAVASLGGIRAALRGVPPWQRTHALRRYIDGVFADRRFEHRFVPADAGGVPAEWVCPPGADPSRRLLYIHGGAFIIGSPRSHRTLTTRFARACGGVVLAIDYRLMPEHRRRAGIDDCRSAYRWLLDNGPDGAAPAQAVFVAGDSAGGNLALALLNWVRDAGLRAPDAAVALSPVTDLTLGSTSLKRNLKTDAMLGPLFGWMTKLPRWLLLWIGFAQNRIAPNDPLVSPEGPCRRHAGAAADLAAHAARLADLQPRAAGGRAGAGRDRGLPARRGAAAGCRAARRSDRRSDPCGDGFMNAPLAPPGTVGRLRIADRSRWSA